MLNICGRQKNIVPTIDTHKRVLIYTDASHEDLFYTLWEAGFGEYDIWIGEGTEREVNLQMQSSRMLLIRRYPNRRLYLS